MFSNQRAAAQWTIVEPGRPHIVVDHVWKEHGGKPVLRDVNASFLAGQIAVVVGGSGAGKTTLLKILAGLDRPTSGRVVIGGTEITALPEDELNAVRKHIGMVFQYSALLDSMSVFDNVAFPLREHTQLSADEIEDKVRRELTGLGLADAIQKFPAELSGGMSKRVALARALILEPEIVMYDEPTSGLDPIMARAVDHLILETRDRLGVTSVVISHDMAAALRIADRIHLLDRGVLVASGTPREVLQSESVHQFFQSSGVDARRLLAEHDAGVPLG
ncbi:MAG TPA: ATP-binding cassette domain-containing protein [Polyangiaceae bacterium]|nr:ATP-binding cassette domain-containing protein [Polyangiaceae bacterium]